MPALRITLVLALGLLATPALTHAAATDESSASATAAADESRSGTAVPEEATAEDAAAAEAVAVVRKNLDAALEVVHGGGTRDEKLASLRSVARDILDTRAMGRRAMGDLLAAQTPQQQEQYFELFDRLIVRAYLQKLLLFRNPRFGYGKPRSEGDVVIVATKIVTAKDEYHVNYEMRQREGRWAASDVIVEGISLAQNYNAQFSSLLRDRSFAELLELMRRKTRPVGEEPK